MYIARYCKKQGIPEEWINYVELLTKKELWNHYFFWEGIGVLKLLEFPQNLKNIRILSFGSGFGVVDALLALKGAKVTLLDYSIDALKDARQRAKTLNAIDEMNFVLGDINKPPFKQNMFDLVWNEGVIEHFKNITKIVENMIFLSKYQGKILLIVPAKWTLHTFIIRPIRRKLNEFPFDRWGEEKSFSETELRELLENIGFENITPITFNLRRAILDDYFILRFLKPKYE